MILVKRRSGILTARFFLAAVLAILATAREPLAATVEEVALNK